MVKKILYCATVDYHFKAFHLPYMKWFKEQGWQVDVASAGDIDLPYTDNKYSILIKRSPIDRCNAIAYKQLKKILDENHYDIIHCHTPLGGVLARLAARQARKKGTKVIYTAHGFHFCKGAPMVNWLIYYPIERYLARHTDMLITINHEDYHLAQKHRFKAKEIVQVSGVGVDIERFKPIDETKKLKLRKSFGYKPDDFLLFYGAEFNKNKNQQFLLHTLALIKEEIPNVRLLLAGEGALLESCKELAQKLDVSNLVDFLGFRKDIDQLLPFCDIAVASSFREGLPVNVMEAMACALPVVAVNNRGHRELITNNQTGWITNDWNKTVFSRQVIMLAKLEDVKKQLGMNARNKIVSTYSTKQVLLEKANIYQGYMEELEEAVWAVR